MTVPPRFSRDDPETTIVTIDGPAGAGKSSVARELARRLGFRFLDTGAMYRAVALAARRRQVDGQDGVALAELARQLDIDLHPSQVLLDGQDVTEQIRAPDITALTRHVADNPEVRDHLVAVQRRLAANTHIVTEGRDQGTVAFPDAHCKIFLTASATERARRRVREMRVRGELTALDDVLAQQNERDHLDRTRTVGPLIPAADAIVVHTDGLDLEQVVDRVETLVREQCRLGHRGQSARPPDPAGGAPRSRSGE